MLCQKVALVFQSVARVVAMLAQVVAMLFEVVARVLWVADIGVNSGSGWLSCYPR